MLDELDASGLHFNVVQSKKPFVGLQVRQFPTQNAFSPKLNVINRSWFSKLVHKILYGPYVNEVSLHVFDAESTRKFPLNYPFYHEY